MRIQKLYQALLCGALGVALSGSVFAAPMVCNPEDFGGKADGETLNTQAIQQAIDKCSVNKGVVVLGPGVWLSGPLKLMSNLTLRFDQGAILRADNRDNKFKPAYIDNKAQEGEAFLFADNAKNITIEGHGVIDGDGAKSWWPAAMDYKAKHQAEQDKIDPNNGMPRPWLVEFNNSKNIKVSNIALTNSPMWNLVLRGSQDVVVDGIKVIAEEHSPNTDGIDIVSSQRVTVKNASIFSGDDNIGIKTGSLPGQSAPSKDIVIEDSLMQKGHGISIGSTTVNGVNSVIIRNIKFEGTQNGVRIKTSRGRGGDIGPVLVEDVTMHDVRTPIIISSHYGEVNGKDSLSELKDYGFKEQVGSHSNKLLPLIHDIEINGLKATGATFAAVLSGLEEAPIKNLSVQHINIQSKYGIHAQFVEGAFINHHIETQSGDHIIRGEHALLKEAR